MSLVLLDGCEDFSSFVSVVGTWSVLAGRNGNGIQPTSINGLRGYVVASAQESATFTAGFAVKFAAAIAGSSCDFFEFRSDAGATSHTCLRVSSDGSISVGRNNGISFAAVGGLGAPGGSIVGDVWYFIELQATLHDTTGSWILRINGVQTGAATNVDTKNAGTKTVYDSAYFRGFNPTTALPIFDDFYLMTGAGDSFLGDIKVETLLPNGNGNANQWTGSDGDSTNNYLLVDEAGTPVLTDFVYSATAAQQDLYTLTDLVATTGVVKGVCHSAHMVRTDAVTPRTVKLVNRRASDTKSADLAISNTGYRSYDYVLALDPETSAAWTIANVNALQSGVELQ